MIDISLLSPELVLIGSQRRAGAGELVTRYYAGTGQPLRQVRLGNEADIDEAVACASAAYRKWSQLLPGVRRDMLIRAASLLMSRSDRLAKIGAIDAGIPVSTVRGFVHHAAEWITYYAGWIDKAGGTLVPSGDEAFNYVRNEPYGVVGVISPSNATVSAMILGPLLAAGNCAVIKSSEFTSNVTLEYLQVFLDAGIPPGVVNCVPGRAEVGEALVRHPGVHKIHFTGSCEVGGKVGSLASSLLKPACMELGGKSANIVFADADLDLAAEIAMRALIRQSGQSCVAGTRVVAHASVIDELLRRTIKRTRAQKIGDPLSDDTIVGPVISQSACERIWGIIECAQKRGDGKIAYGGERAVDVDQAGYFVNPTIFSDVDNASRLAQEEIFGPVISFSSFETTAEAIEMANATRFGLAAYMQTRDLFLAHRTAAQLDAGIVWMNGAPGVLPNAPFGGVKNSGYGRVGGEAGLQEFLRPKNVWIGI